MGKGSIRTGKPLPGALEQVKSLGTALSILLSSQRHVVVHSLACLSTLYQSQARWLSAVSVVVTIYEAEDEDPAGLGPFWAT